MRVIGIFGLGHSGSTLLERCLSSHSQCVGLGEVDLTVEAAAHSGAHGLDPCTCGSPAADCSVWSILDSADGQSGDAECIGNVFRRAGNVAGRSTIVDSSKRLGQALVLARMHNAGQLQVVPVFLIRDYRSWVISRKVSRYDRGWGVVDYVKRAWVWILRNEKTRRGLQKNGIDAVPVWYEDFVQAPESVAAPVFQRAGLEPMEIDPGRACQHAVNGNNMRYDPALNSTIVVNERWKRDWRNRLLLPLVLGPAIYNFWLRHRARRGRI